LGAANPAFNEAGQHTNQKMKQPFIMIYGKTIMNRTVNVRLKGVILFFAILTLLSSAAHAGGLSNKWRINVNHDAKSDGTMIFRVSPKDQPPIDMTVNIKDGTNENRVAVAIREAFQAQLPKDGYHIERDDFEDVLIKKRGDTPNFGLKLVSSNVEKVKIRMHKE
jgi:hypothetical protein